MTQLIVALDSPSFDEAIAVVDALGSRVGWYKVGYQAYYGYGERIIEALSARGASLFLDLKLHDIPNTVGAAVRAAARLRPKMLTVHASGGRPMLAAAAQARDDVNAAGGALRLLAVTALTSLSEVDLAEIGEAHPHQLVSLRTEAALKAGIDGLVCAVDEVPIVRARVGQACIVVCPGIRPGTQPSDDQHRIATPAQAVLAGADYIVVGRPIAQAPDPATAATAVLDEMASVSPLGST